MDVVIAAPRVSHEKQRGLYEPVRFRYDEYGPSMLFLQVAMVMRISCQAGRAARRCLLAAVVVLLVPGCGGSDSPDQMAAKPSQPPVNQQPVQADEEPEPLVEPVRSFRLKELQRVQVGMERHFQISQDRQVMVGRSEDRTSVLVWDITGKKLHATLQTDRLGEGLFGRVAVSPDGSQVAAQIDAVELSGDTQIAVWNTDNPAEARIVSIPSLQLGEMAISNTELMVAYGPHVLIYSHLNGDHIANLSGHDETEGISTVRAIQLSPSGRFLLSMGSDRIALLWDLETRKEIQIFDEHEDDVTCGAFGEDERTIVTGSDDLSVKRWEVTNGTSIRTWQLAEYDALKVAERKLQAINRRMEAMVAAADGRAEFVPSPAGTHTVITGVDLSDRSSTLLVNLFVGQKEDGSGFKILFPGNPVLLDVVTEKPLSLVSSEVNEKSIARQTRLGMHVSFFNRRGDGFWYPGVQFVRKRGEDITLHNARELQIVGYQLTNAAGPVKQIAVENIKHREPREDLVDAAKEVNPSDIFKEDGDIAEMMPGIMDGMMGGGMMGDLEGMQADEPLDLTEEMKKQERDEFFIRDFGEREFLHLQPNEGDGTIRDIDGTSVLYRQVKPLLDVLKVYLEAMENVGDKEFPEFQFRDLAFADGERGDMIFPPGLFLPGVLFGSSRVIAQGKFIFVPVAEVDRFNGQSVDGEHLLGGAVDDRVIKKYRAKIQAISRKKGGLSRTDVSSNYGPGGLEGDMEGMMEGAGGPEDKILTPEQKSLPGLFFCEVIQSDPRNRTGNVKAVGGPSVMGLPLLVDGDMSNPALGALRRALPGTRGYSWGMEGDDVGMADMMAGGGGMEAMMADMGERITGFTAYGVDSLVVRSCMLLLEKPKDIGDAENEEGRGGESGAKRAGENHPLSPQLVDEDRFVVRIFIDVERVEPGIERLGDEKQKRINDFLGGLGTWQSVPRSRDELLKRLLSIFKSESSSLNLLYLFGDSEWHTQLRVEQRQRRDEVLLDPDRQSDREWVVFSEIDKTVDKWRQHLGSVRRVISISDGVEITGVKGKIRFQFHNSSRGLVLSGVELLDP
jgi:hypothetical protein